MMETLWQDVKYGARMLWKSPGFTLVAVLTLALGIGANTAIFTLVNAVLLRDLPYPESEQLIRVFHSYPNINLARGTVNVPGFLEYQRVTKSYQSMGAFTGYRSPENLTSGDVPQRVRTVTVSAGFFPTLGVQPSLGRTFAADEDAPGANRVVILSHRIWQSHFASDSNVLGRKITLDGADYEIIGVMPQGFGFPSLAELWVPIAFTPEQRAAGTEYLNVVARMRPGVTIAQAQAELESVAEEIRRRFNVASASVFTLTSASLREATVGDIRPPLLILAGAVGFVLLIACANLANLLLVRAAARQREISIRLALGASRWRVVRQMLTEGVVLAMAGGGLGVLAAFWGLDVMLQLVPISLPGFVEVKIDLATLAFTGLLAVLTGILFGAIPALQATRAAVVDRLKEGGRGTESGAHNRTCGVLVTLELAMALVLLVGAGLMIQSFARLQEARHGFDPNGVLTMNISLPQARYSTPELRHNFYQQLLERVARLPGVESASAVTSLPLVIESSASFTIEGRDLTPRPLAFTAGASPDYFHAMRIPLLKGRVFDQRDLLGGAPVAIVDERAASAHWPGEQAVGKRISLASDPVWREVVGVVGAVKHTSALTEDTKGQVYYPLAQVPRPSVALALRASGDPQGLASAVRAETLKLDSTQPVFDVKTMSERLSDYVAQPRFNMVLLGIFTGLSLVLAAVGTYGVISYSVSQRRQEIGIRMALGAQPGAVLRLVLGHGLRVILIGLAIGLGGCWALTRVLETQLFGVRPSDPLTFGASSLLLAGAALLATWIPARRAAKVDPMVALRHE